MKNLLNYVSVAALMALGLSESSADTNQAATPDEVVVEGKVLYSNQVNALK